ncbi:hypothetical protein [Hymenobacter sp. 102]|uniref:hypothetical protein n=1 Tax=Hymenobacter sp. 102 TaxID=3403152 RepID=UPI003CED567B
MRFLALLASSLLLASCTLTPRTSRGRTLSPDREAAAPDRILQDTIPADSLAPSGQ